VPTCKNVCVRLKILVNGKMLEFIVPAFFRTAAYLFVCIYLFSLLFVGLSVFITMLLPYSLFLDFLRVSSIY
jgi:hypothetical protein